MLCTLNRLVGDRNSEITNASFENQLDRCSEAEGLIGCKTMEVKYKASTAIPKRKLWVNKVFAMYAAGLTRWRRSGSERPSLAASVEACQAGLNFDVYAQLLAQQAGTTTPRKVTPGQRPPKGDAPPKRTGDKPPKGGRGDAAVYASVPAINVRHRKKGIGRGFL